jgi:hypothetical protein
MTFGCPPRTFRITLLFGAFLGLCAEANYLLRYLLAEASSHIAIKMERVQEDLLPSANGWWRDLVAVTIFAIIKVYLLIRFGIRDWHDNDGAGYITLAESFRGWQTWVSVPDLQSTVTPLSLLRMPGYSLLILMMQVTAGDFWIAAMISLQLVASGFATFVLYRTIWSFSSRWFVGILGAAWFASSSIGWFELCILSDSFATSIFTTLLCGIGLVVFRGRLLTPLAVAAIATAFPLLFLLREANILLALALVPLVWAALPRTHRLGRLTGVYAPLALVFIMMALWQQYRTGYFLVTTGGQGNPVEALALIDKISPILDQENPVDRAVRSVTAGMAPSDVAQDSWSIAVKINEFLAEQLDIRAPQIARLALNRYLSVWLEHPFEMLAHVARNQTIIRTAGVSPVIYNDRHLSARTREFHSFASQRMVEWGLINLPLLWFAVLIVAAPLRRTALMTFGLWVTCMVPVLFYSAMFLETRYVLSSLGPILLVLALTTGTGIRVLSRKATAAMRHCGTPSSALPPSIPPPRRQLFAGTASKFYRLG